VLQKVGEKWKIKHYVLSITIPNEDVEKVVKIKEATENQLITSIKKHSK